jgi:signal transduction histidine kinase
MPIRTRIVLPLAGLFLLIYGALSLVSILMVASAAEDRMIDQLRTLARFLESWDVSLNRTSLDHIRSATGTEIVVSTPEGLALGLSSAPPEVIEAVRARLAAGARDFSQLALPGGRSFVAVRARLRGGRDVFLLYYDDAISDRKVAAVVPLLFLSAVGLLGVVGVAYFVARGIARPIEELARHAREIVDLKADRPLEARGGSNETRHLVESLNRMLGTLRQAQERVIEAQRSSLIREMAAGVAHEIKNPLQAIQMIVQTAAGLPDADRRILLDEIRRVELASLELLTLSGPVKLNRAPAALSDVVDRTVELLRRSFDHLGVSVRREVLANGTYPVDADRIQRAVMNLLLNGAQAMPGGGELDVRVSRTPEGWGRISVTDRGPGIPDEVRSRLFEPFVTTKQDGVGLGLYVTRAIVEQHGGRVGVESKPGETTVYLELPPK